MNIKKAFRENSLQVIFVFLAFAFMVVIGGFFVSNIIRNEAKEKVTLSLGGTENSISAYLHGTKVAYDSIYMAVQDLLDRGEPLDIVTQYLFQTTDRLKNEDDGVIGFIGVYGYIFEELIGISYDPGDDYIPQHRSWYQQSIRNSDATYTAPYLDDITGKTIMSLTQKLYGKNGDYYGVLALDIDTAWLTEFLEELRFTEGGYGIITNQFINIIAHPQDEYINSSLQDFGSGYAEISDMLRTGKEVSAKRIKDIDGTNIIVFFMPLHTEWFLGVVMPVGSYYADLFSAIIVLSALGAVMALILSGILLSISSAKIRSEEENEIIMSSIRYASKIQRSLLPRDGIFEAAFKDYSITWKPRDIVGGDIYWAKNFEDGTVLSVCDCTGHGTPGALLTMLVASIFDTSITAENHRDTAHILYTLDQRLAAVMNVDSGVDIKHGGAVINDGCDLAVLFIAKDGSVTFSSGHTQVFVCDGIEVTQFRGQKIFIGEGKLKSKSDVKVVTIPANPNNKFYIATDGLYEQPGGKNERPYGYKAFKQIILENHNERQSVISGKIWNAYEEYRAKFPQTDDFELITFIP